MTRHAWAPMSAVLCIVLPLTGCGGTGSGDAGGTGLTITVTLDEGVAPDVWTLNCDPANGTHPDPAGACDFLQTAADSGVDPFAPVPDDTACSQEYRGPATATVEGLWNGEPVDASFRLINGCGIARWTLAEPLLGAVPAAN